MEKNKNKKPNSTFSAFIDYSTSIKISDSIDKMDIRILYTGKNRNGSYFDKEVVEKMCEKIGGVPIIGMYDEEKEDFLDHGELELVITEDGELDSKMVGPVPYGFVPPQAKYWWAEHEDENGEVKNYLHSEVYLWTKRYPELEILKDGNNNQSMELDPESICGDYSVIDGEHVFKFTEAEFIGFCILGKDVEPCFEGASFIPNFNLNNNFSNALSSMKEELNNISFTNPDEEEEDIITIEEIETEEIIEEQNEEFDNSLDEVEEPTAEELLEIELEEIEIEDIDENSEFEENYEELYLEIQEEYNKTLDELEKAKKELGDYKNLISSNLNKIKEFKNELSDELYESFISEEFICNNSLEQITTQLQTAAYNYIKAELANERSKKNSTLFTMSSVVEEENTNTAKLEPWQAAVVEKQKNK